MSRMDINGEVYVMNEDRLIYKLSSVEEISCTGYGLSYMLDLVAGHDYINPDESNAQGFVSAEAFVESVQWESFTVYPLEESLGERLTEEGYTVINIKDYKIHPYKGGEE